MIRQITSTDITPYTTAISEKTAVIECLEWTWPQVCYSHTRKLQHNPYERIVGLKVWWFCKIEFRKLSHSCNYVFKGQAAILESEEEEEKTKRVGRIGAPLLAVPLFVLHSGVSCHDNWSTAFSSTIICAALRCQMSWQFIWLLCIGLNPYNS